MSSGKQRSGNDLDAERFVVPANRYYLRHMLKHVERCLDAVDIWLANRQANWTADLAEGKLEIQPFDLPVLWLPASVQKFLLEAEATDENGQTVTRSRIASFVQDCRGGFDAQASNSERARFVQEIEVNLAGKVRTLVAPFERLRLEIWTRLQQLDVLSLSKDAKPPEDLIQLPNALSIEQMVEQSLSSDPKSRMRAFVLPGPWNLEVDLIQRTVSRREFEATVDFGSKTTSWVPFIVAFFSGRSGNADGSVEELCKAMLQRRSDTAEKNRDKYRRDANGLLDEIQIEITKDWCLQPFSE